MKQKTVLKILLVFFIFTMIFTFFAFDLQQYANLETAKEKQQELTQFYENNRKATIIGFAGMYVLITALSLPGAIPMTLAAGALFGLLLGTIIVSFASAIGATLAFLSARFLMQDYVQTKYRNKLTAINNGIAKEGVFYLFTLRLVPLFPFFLINLVMGLTPIRITSYYLVSQIGMLPGTTAYIFAGTQLAQLESLQGILSPKLLLAFTLLGLFPLVSKKAVHMLRAGRKLKKFRKPPRFDYNVIVIGAGSGGLVSAYIGAAIKAKVALIEQHKMGGDCLNTGCVPSKALLRSAKMLSYAKRSTEFGLGETTIQFDFSDVMAHVQRVIQKVAPHDSVERYRQLGVECISGAAKIVDPYRVEVNGQELTTRNIIIATGARPMVPPIPGITNIPYLTSDTLWNIQELPKRFLVLGGGPIGCELAQAFSRFGAEVTIVEMAPQLLIREDQEVSELITKKFKQEGIRVLTGHKAIKFVSEAANTTLVCEAQGEQIEIAFDQVLLALGRKANVHGFGLEELGVEIAPGGVIAVDGFMRTNYPTIFACGDVAGPYQFTHTAAHQAWYASVNALFAPIKKFKVDYRVIPWSTFIDPEVARVGLNEKTAKLEAIPYDVNFFQFEELDRAIADCEDHGFIKVLTVPGKDKILGVTIVGTHGGDLIAEFVFAMKQGLGLNKILGTIHIYPTLVEANKYVAGSWKKAHAPKNVLNLLEKYHAWRR